MNREEYNILKLIRSKNVGSHTFFKLLNFFSNCIDAIENIDEFNKKFKLKNPIVIATDEELNREIIGCSTIGAEIISYRNSSYPKALLEISDFPPVLTVLGQKDLLNRDAISIVGARSASSNGCNFANKLARELGEADYAIVSGFASGIDTAAHKGSLDTGTIAVLGGGVDDIYPRGNEELYYEIKNKGLIISEVPLNSAPRAENFPSRNRIVSGLSKAIIIIEAGARSGTIHTARQALEQGKEILVAPGNPYDCRCEGSNKLIKDGANVITCTDDVIYILNSSSCHSTSNSLKLEESLKNYSENYSQNEIDDVFEKNEDSGNDISASIISKLNYTPIDIETLADDLGVEINKLNSYLVELELDGRVVIERGSVRLP